MNPGDELLRAYSILTSLRDTLPTQHYVSESWAHKLNDALAKVEAAVGGSLNDFKLPRSELEQVVASSSMGLYDERPHVTYRDGLWCERAVLLQRITAALTYFTGLQSGDPAKIGFRTNA